VPSIFIANQRGGFRVRAGLFDVARNLQAKNRAFLLKKIVKPR